MFLILFTALTLLATFVVPAQAQYTYETIPFLPGATGVTITAVDETDLVLIGYMDAELNDHAALRTPQGQVLPLPGMTARAFCDGDVVGFQPARFGGVEMFLFRVGTVTNGSVSEGSLRLRRVVIPKPGPGPGKVSPITEPVACQGQTVVGSYLDPKDPTDPNDDVFRGFLYDKTTDVLTTFDGPSARHTTLTGVDTLGRVLGRLVGLDDVIRLFRRETDGTLTFLTIPGFADADVGLVGLTTLNRLAGNLPNAGQAFVFDDTEGVTMITPPGADLVQIFGGDEVRVWGRARIAGVDQPFIATRAAPEPGGRGPKPPHPRGPKPR